MKTSHHTKFTRGGVNQIRPNPVLFIPPEAQHEELEQAPLRTASAQVLTRPKPKAVRSKYQRG
jgi:hypothetical protein